MPPLILSDKAHITQGDLPHWDDKKAIYFATLPLPPPEVHTNS